MKPALIFAHTGEWFRVTGAPAGQVFGLIASAEEWRAARPTWSLDLRVGVERDREGKVTVVVVAAVLRAPDDFGWVEARCETVRPDQLRFAYEAAGVRACPPLSTRPPARRSA